MWEEEDGVRTEDNKREKNPLTFLQRIHIVLVVTTGWNMLAILATGGQANLVLLNRNRCDIKLCHSTVLN